MKYIIALTAGLALGVMSMGAREFNHPGGLYSQADLDRMKAMVEAGREPYYSTFVKLQQSSYSRFVDRNRGTSIGEGKFNSTVGEDGRRAHDLALLWHITGEEKYAQDVVKILNFSSYYTNCSSRGTGPLDNGKVWLLLEAAELMHDYEGWKAEDRQRFADMLVHPGYSTTEVPESHYSLNDAENDVTFYWNIYNFDASRFGNQGLFAARAMMTMGVFLDNETMYDRAYRYISGLPHRADDLPYVPGPPVTSTTPYALDADYPEAGDKTTSFMYGYELKGRENTIEDYGYDEQLRYYIYANGQSQEACRDQDHAMVGVGLLVDIAEIAHNQGDDLYGQLDNRILKGMEWCYRYNLSYKLNPATAWEPTGYTTMENQATLDNGMFLRVTSRSGRWRSLKQSTKGRGDSFQAGGNRECALAHYAVRLGLPESDYKWTREYRDYLIDNFENESYGKDSNHAYEWAGWGTLTKRREADMSGNPGHVVDGKFVSHFHAIHETIACSDYDRLPGASLAVASRAARVAPMANSDGSVAVTTTTDPMTYTIVAEAANRYDLVFRYRATGASSLNVTINGKDNYTLALPEAATSKVAYEIVTLPAGPSTIKVAAAKADGLVLESLEVQKVGTTGVVEPVEIDAVRKSSFVATGIVNIPGATSIEAYDTAGRLVARSDGETLTLPGDAPLVVKYTR